jgi:outer membrane protein
MSASGVTKHFYHLAVLLLLVSAVQADQRGQKPQGEQPGLFLGAGLMIQDKPLKGVGAKVYPLPFYMYRGKAFSMRGLSASYEILGDENWAIRGLARFRTDGYEADDSSDLDGMSDRRNSLDLGAELWFENSWGNVGLDWVVDALGQHDGHEARLSYVMPFRGAFGIKKLGLRPMLGLNWRSDNLNNYYYGVRAREATANRAVYRSGRSVNPYAGVALDYQLAERWSIFSLFRNEWLGNEITDSPIVDQDSKISVILGLLYRF